jgi:hypothetical protein
MPLTGCDPRTDHRALARRAAEPTLHGVFFTRKGDAPLPLEARTSVDSVIGRREIPPRCRCQKTG